MRAQRRVVLALLRVLRSRAFKRDLTELSAYGARIKHERPIVLFCAKYLRRAEHDVVLEGGEHDLTVDGVTFEFKHHFDWDIPKARAESKWWRPRRGKGESWRVLAAIHRDIIERRPDVFVWIISERSLDGVGKDYCKAHVCFWREQRRHAQRRWTSAQTLQGANRVLNRIAAPRRGGSHFVSVETRARFVSTYHFLIRSFRGGSRSA